MLPWKPIFFKTHYRRTSLNVLDWDMHGVDLIQQPVYYHYWLLENHWELKSWLDKKGKENEHKKILDKKQIIPVGLA